MPTAFQKDPFRTVGNAELSAWAVDEVRCRIQTRNRQIAKRLKKLTDCELVGWAVKGPFLQIFSMPYTLAWVEREVVGWLGGLKNAESDKLKK